MTNDDTASGEVGRPDGWPELWLDPGPPCSHTYHWNDADGRYQCMDCGDTVDEPPESKRSQCAGTERGGDGA